MSLDDELDRALERQQEAMRSLVLTIQERQAWQQLQRDLVDAAKSYGREIVRAAVPILVAALAAAVKDKLADA